MSCPNAWKIIAIGTFILMGCTRPVPVETSSTMDSDTSRILEAATITPADTVRSAAEEPSFTREIERLRQSMGNETGLYEISISTMQYEASSDVTWNFDQGFSPVYFKDTWAMEGVEGSTEYFIVDNNLHCVAEDESYGTGTSTTKWCRTTGGIKTTYDDDRGQEQTDVLPDNYEREVTATYAGKLSILTQILKTATLESDESDIYRLKIEEKPYEGDDFVETTTITIPKALYDDLMK